MPNLSEYYDPELVQLMTGAMDDACAELRVKEGESNLVRLMMSVRIMSAVNAGERDPERLRLLALHSVDGRCIDG